MVAKTLKEKFINEVYNYLVNYGIISFGRNFEREGDMELRQLIEKFYIFYEELLEWNKKINLTAITGMDEFIKKHIIDSAFLLKILRTGNECGLDGAKSIMDIGSGAGLPGIILSILRPDLHVISVERVFKKCNFQKAAARKLNLSNFRCLNENIFTYKDFSNIDAITTRAAFNADELINLIERLDLKSGTGLYLFLSKTDEVKKIETFKYKSKRVSLDRILFYKTDYTDKNSDFRLIAKFTT
ncbi:MAG: 16S rRNA (guanine(527)-N(7))-methyltransferase RsmG [Deltaproteobacteria bacterium]|jgi:16S rRNA (guanine(527)-N(7))-methyltransferase RsmG|nr:16S rRNA (guanine(527)-N(7))-methyltransferase RsmG [Deltaproteobacteria bacterium]MCL5879206.1 16S rRNA (guanine(527)-N(7))-methyltransferase RsmG [Deltaproteobacteria bacterium]MDA8305012.1 16S rRNA (guanine(527)-N(7))-methyltransferase RsmG [Deltaproteobacteria bacterium]